MNNASQQWEDAEKAINPLAAEFEMASQFIGMPPFEKEYKFSMRKFRADYGWPDQRVIVEVEGGVFGTGKPCKTCGHRKGGAHGSISGILRDIEKYNLATSIGFRVFRFGPAEKKDPIGFCRMVMGALNAH